MKNVISNAKDYPTCVSDNMTKSEMDGLQVLFFFSFLFFSLQRFTQYLASSNSTFQLSNFLDKSGVQGMLKIILYSMKVKNAIYLNHLVILMVHVRGSNINVDVLLMQWIAVYWYKNTHQKIRVFNKKTYVRK
jgi:hypothetical protein